MKHTRENQERPASELNAGQLAIRLSNRTDYLGQLDQKIEGARQAAVIGAPVEHVKNLKAKRKLIENEIKLLKRRLARLTGKDEGLFG